MEYNVGVLWGIYVGVTAFFLLVGLGLAYYFSCRGRAATYGLAVLIAFILGAIAAFIGAAWLDPNTMTEEDNVSLTILLVVAIVLPILAIIYVIWAGECSSWWNGSNGCATGACPVAAPCDKPCDKPCPPVDPCHDKCSNPIYCPVKEKVVVSNGQTHIASQTLRDQHGHEIKICYK